MAQITSGVRAILSTPIIYNFLQKAMGAHRSRTHLVEKIIRPESRIRILDIGSGTSEILHYLPEDIEYWGFDISAEYIAAAKKKFGARGNFHCEIITQSLLAKLPKFDRVLALGVLHHLEDDQAREMIDLACDALSTGGRLITVDPCLTLDQHPIARYLVRKDRGQNVREAEAYLNLAKCSFQDIRGLLRHQSWIPYTHWIMDCKK